MKSRTLFTQVYIVQDFMLLSLQIGVKESHTTTSTPQELTTGMTMVWIMDLQRKLWGEHWLTLELTVLSVELQQAALNGDSA